MVDDRPSAVEVVDLPCRSRSSRCSDPFSHSGSCVNRSSLLATQYQASAIINDTNRR